VRGRRIALSLRSAARAERKLATNAEDPDLAPRGRGLGR
jgi:hypothetical protein